MHLCDLPGLVFGWDDYVFYWSNHLQKLCFQIVKIDAFCIWFFCFLFSFLSFFLFISFSHMCIWNMHSICQPLRIRFSDNSVPISFWCWALQFEWFEDLNAWADAFFFVNVIVTLFFLSPNSIHNPQCIRNNCWHGLGGILYFSESNRIVWNLGGSFVTEPNFMEILEKCYSLKKSQRTHKN